MLNIDYSLSCLFYYLRHTHPEASPGTGHLFCLVGWGKGEEGGYWCDDGRLSFPQFVPLLQLQKLMLSRINEEVSLHLTDALNVRVGAGLTCGYCTVLLLTVPVPCTARWEGERLYLDPHMAVNIMWTQVPVPRWHQIKLKRQSWSLELTVVWLAFSIPWN